MRSSLTLRSEMPGPKSYTGWWGSFGTQGQRGVVSYGLSANAQRPFAGALHGYVFNGYRRFMKHVPFWIAPFSIAYGVYVWGDKKYDYLHSKAGHAAAGHEEH